MLVPKLGLSDWPQTVMVVENVAALGSNPSLSICMKQFKALSLKPLRALAKIFEVHVTTLCSSISSDNSGFDNFH